MNKYCCRKKILMNLFFCRLLFEEYFLVQGSFAALIGSGRIRTVVMVAEAKLTRYRTGRRLVHDPRRISFGTMDRKIYIALDSRAW